jgi:hypothetical protein
MKKIVRFRAPVRVFHDYPMHYLEVPPKVVKALGGKFRLRLICTLNGRHSFHCGLMALGGGSGYLTLSRQRMAEIGARPGDSLRVALRVDESKYGMEMPREFREVLRQDREGRKRFEALKPGKQRTILYHVAGTKDVDRRIDRSLRLVENLKRLPLGKESIPGIFGRPIRPGSGRW